MLHRNVEGLQIEQFIREDNSDVAEFWWDAKEQGKEGMVNRKKSKKRSTEAKQLRFTNQLTNTFLESSSEEDEGNVI